MNIYQTCYDLVNQYIYGSSIQVGTYQDLVAIVVATAACIFVFALPFFIVKKCLETIFNGIR